MGSEQSKEDSYIQSQFTALQRRPYMDIYQDGYDQTQINGAFNQDSALLETKPAYHITQNQTQWSASAAWNPNVRDELISITHQSIKPKKTEDRVELTNQLITIAESDSKMVMMLKSAIQKQKEVMERKHLIY